MTAADIAATRERVSLQARVAKLTDGLPKCSACNGSGVGKRGGDCGACAGMGIPPIYRAAPEWLRNALRTAEAERDALKAERDEARASAAEWKHQTFAFEPETASELAIFHAKLAMAEKALVEAAQVLSPFAYTCVELPSYIQNGMWLNIVSYMRLEAKVLVDDFRRVRDFLAAIQPTQVTPPAADAPAAPPSRPGA